MNENNIEVILNLDKAAFMILQGAELIGFKGKRARDCKVIIKTRPEILATMSVGMINFKDYMHARKKLKIKMKKAYGIYES